MKRFHFLAGDIYLDGQPLVRRTEDGRMRDDAKWLSDVLTDEFHGALRTMSVSPHDILDLANRVDALNTCLDCRAAWMKCGGVR